MKFRNIKFALLVLVAIAFESCETLPDQEVEYAPTWPISGEWLSHVYNEDGTPASLSLFALRTYNTADNVNNKVWIRLGTTQTVAVWGKVDCDLNQKTISGQNISNSAKANNTFSIQEGKVLLGQTKLHSGVMGDSIYVRYTTTVDGKTYIVKGHRRTGWNEDEY